MKTQVKITQTDENLMMRLLEIRFPRHTIKTPMKTANKHTPVSGINEIFHRIDMKRIETINTDSTEEQKFNRKIMQEKSGDMANLVFLSYHDKVVPARNDMGVMADLQYVHSDAAVVPLCPNLFKNRTGENLRESFMEYVKQYFEIVETLNNKTIVGFIPLRMPRQYVLGLLDFYHSRDITSFVIDSDGTSLYSYLSWLKEFQRKLYELGILDEGFLYNINSGEGKFMKNAEIILARDFITLPFGIDVLGSNHKAPPLSTEGWQRIKASRFKGPRVFDPLTYGYARHPDPYIKRKEIRKENIIRQHNETVKIQKVIKEENSAADYMHTKQQVKNHDVVSLVEKTRHVIRGDEKQRSLFDAL